VPNLGPRFRFDLKNQRKNFEIVLGRIDSGSCSGKAFAAVRDLDDLARERVRSALRTAGRGPATNLTVLSDGEDAMRLMAGQWLSGRVEHRLDWSSEAPISMAREKHLLGDRLWRCCHAKDSAHRFGG
jgi:hypothetical protein